MFKRLLRILAGGRPMTKLMYAYTERRTGKEVWYYVDTLGRAFLAQDGEYSFLRVRVPVDFVMERLNDNDEQ